MLGLRQWKGSEREGQAVGVLLLLLLHLLPHLLAVLDGVLVEVSEQSQQSTDVPVCLLHQYHQRRLEQRVEQRQ